MHQVKQILWSKPLPNPTPSQSPSNAPLDHRRRLEGLREIYEGAQKLLDMEVGGSSSASIATQREWLDAAYDRFVPRFGPISNKLHHKLLANSPALPFLLALEYDYDPLTNTAKKALIFSESTVRSAAQPDEIQNLPGCASVFPE